VTKNKDKSRISPIQVGEEYAPEKFELPRSIKIAVVLIISYGIFAFVFRITGDTTAYWIGRGLGVLYYARRLLGCFSSYINMAGLSHYL
jgi:hypothetical protein